MIENYEGMKETAKELKESVDELFSKIDDLKKDLPEEDKKHVIEYKLKFGAS